MSLVSIERPLWQLGVSFMIGIVVSIISTNIFGIVLNLHIGLLIAVMASILFALWAGRIRSHRVLGSLGHVITYSIFYFGIEKAFFKGLQTIAN